MMIAPAPDPVAAARGAAAHRSPGGERVGAALRIGGARASAVSLWWIVMLRAQGAYGADVLAYSESLQATSLTSASTETLRGMGYWLFYVRDPYAFTTTASQTYMESGRAIAHQLRRRAAVPRRARAHPLVAAPVRGAAGVRRHRAGGRRAPHRRRLAADVAAGRELAQLAGAGHSQQHPRAADVEPRARARAPARWSPRSAATRWRLRVARTGCWWCCSRRQPAGAVRRQPRRPGARARRGPAGRVASRPPTTCRPRPSEYRVLQLPGSEFGAFRWGYTVDPPLPGLTTKPLVTRDLLPLGLARRDGPALRARRPRAGPHARPRRRSPPSPAASASTPSGWPTTSRFDRFRTPRPEEVAALFDDRRRASASPSHYGDAGAQRARHPDGRRDTR